jgi:hypothetical protein
MNEKFFIDGQTPDKEAAVEFQGLEDSFGFSWGFPEPENIFPMTGYFPFLKGGAAYRFFINDAISFDKSLRVSIGFGIHENPAYGPALSKPGTELQLSSTCYWYQTEPHAPLPAMLPVAERAPALEDPFWPGKEPPLPSTEELKNRGVKLEMLAGRPKQEIIFAESGYDAKALNGYAYAGWPVPVYYTRADNEQLRIELTLPKNTKGTLRLYVIDPDNFRNGRKETITVGGKSLGLVEDFQKGRWIETQLGPEQTKDGRVLIEVTNAKEKANAVISIVEWVTAK